MAILLLALRPLVDIKVDPLIALPLGGLLVRYVWENFATRIAMRLVA